MKKQLKTPILFLAFNRPETTKLVFEEIRRAKPKNLFIHIDGPRKGNQEDEKKIKEVKKIVSKIDWSCKVKKLYRKTNKGISKGVLKAINNWFFENVDEGIIFDDDCVPTSDFFKFCEEMLKKYRNNERIMHISGYNFQRGWSANQYSYYFSKYPYVWGWATWKRARKKYDGTMKDYPKLKKKGFFKKIFPSTIERNYVLKIMDDAYYKNPNAVDTRWFFSIIINKGLSIVPNKNLVRNIGFRTDSSHTKSVDSFLSLPTGKMKFPLKHPPIIARNRKADERYVRWLLKHRIKKHFLLKTGLHKLLG